MKIFEIITAPFPKKGETEFLKSSDLLMNSKEMVMISNVIFKSIFCNNCEFGFISNAITC